VACPYISVLTVAGGRPEALLRKAGALAQQTLEPERFEWVVCLNGGDDGSAGPLQAMELPFSLKLFETSERLPAGAARNACAARTCGSILLFSDDDCLPAPHTLAAHVAEQERGLCAAVGGIDFDDGGRIDRWRPSRVGFWNLNGANSSVPAVAFREVGGFDEELAGYGGEDLELGYRLTRAGLPFRALPEATAVHLGPDPRAGADLGKARAAGANAARLAQRHPPLRWRVGLHPLQVATKRLLFATGLGAWLHRLGGGSVAYERAYLEGARDAGGSPMEESA
jgi:glycosyltransferase involved in cell wall biosynthesis